MTLPQSAPIAASITCPSNGLPQSWRRFLFGTRVEPPRAGIRIKRLIDPKVEELKELRRGFWGNGRWILPPKLEQKAA